VTDMVGEETVTLALALPKLGVLAVIMAEPCTRPVTATFTLLVPVANVTVGGTVATPVLLELRLAIKPPDGAGPDRPSVKVCEEPAPIVRLGGEKELLPPPVSTCICPLPAA
jgi:hypothetical protein